MAEAVLHITSGQGASLQTAGEAGRRWLKAAQSGKLKHLKSLYAADKRVASNTDEDSNSALMLAVGYGHCETVRWLLEEGGASITEHNNQGYTAFLLASQEGHLELVQWLLLKGNASVSERILNGSTALILAARKGQIEVVQWLVQTAGAMVKDKDKKGYTALLHAVVNGRLSVVKWLLEKGGSSITDKPDVSNTLLLEATQEGRHDIVRWLLEKGGASVKDRSNYGSIAVLTGGGNDLIKWLLQDGGAERTSSGRSALMLAASHDQLAMVQWLVREGGASIAEPTHDGRTALTLAIAQGHAEVARWLADDWLDLPVASIRSSKATAQIWASYVCPFRGGSVKERWQVLEHSCFEQSIPAPLKTANSWLVFLDMSHQHLTKLPVVHDATFYSLDVSRNKLTELPASWIHRECVWINAASNRLSQLPANINEAKQLAFLDTSDNLLSELPAGFSLPALRCLRIARNRIKKLPSTLGDAVDLQSMDVQGNPLLALPSSLRALKRLRDFNVQDTPMYHAISNDNRTLETPELLAALLAIFDENASQHSVFRAPVLLCGESRAGKTTLAYQLVPLKARFEVKLGALWSWLQVDALLQGRLLILTQVDKKRKVTVLELQDYQVTACKLPREFILVHRKKWFNEVILRMGPELSSDRWLEALVFASCDPRTEGIRVSSQEWEIAHCELLEMKMSLEQKMDNATRVKNSLYLALWDFAGEQEYFWSHRLFFPSQAVYVGVWDMSRQQRGLEELGEWLQKAKHYGELRAQTQSKLTAEGDQAKMNVLVIVGTHLDAVSPNKREERERAVRQLVSSLELGWDLISVEEVDLGLGSDVRAVGRIRESIVRAASKLECMGSLVDVSVYEVLETLVNLKHKVVQRVAIEATVSCKQNLDYALLQLSRWSKCIYFPKLSHAVIADPNWLTEQVMGRLVRVSKDLELQKLIWPANKSRLGLIYSAEQVDVIWTNTVQAELGLETLLQLLEEYGLLLRVPGHCKGLKSAFVLPFMIPSVNQLPEKDRNKINDFFVSRLPTVSRAFVTTGDKMKRVKAMSLDWAGLSARLVGRLLNSGGCTVVENVSVCHEAFLLTLAGNAFMLGKITEGSVMISVVSPLNKHKNGRLQLCVWLEIACNAVRKELCELHCEFSERVLCPICLRQRERDCDWWPYSAETRQLACTTLQCVHTVDQHLCAYELVGLEEKREQSVSHGMDPLPLWLLLGREPPQDLNLESFGAVWAEDRLIFPLPAWSGTSFKAEGALSETSAEYQDLLHQARQALIAVCRQYHMMDQPAFKLAMIQPFVEQASKFVGQLLVSEMKLKAVKDLVGMFSEDKQQEFDYIGGQPQPVLENYRTVAGFVEISNKAQEHFNRIIRSICGEAGVAPAELKVGPVKAEHRLREKAKDQVRRGLEPFAVFDMNRATILSVTPVSFGKVLLALTKHFELLKLKNKFFVDMNDIKEPPCLLLQMGFRCNELAVFMQAGQKWVVELQITTPGILKVKDEFSHALYELTRTSELPPNCVVCHN